MEYIDYSDHVIYIEPKSTLPLLSSDKLAGSIVYGISELFPEKINDIVNDFKKLNHPFIVSSGFPYIKTAKKIIRFFPKPIQKPLKPEDRKKFDNIEKEIEYFKKSKELGAIEFLDEITFYEIINGKITNLELFDLMEQKQYFIKNNRFLLCKDNNEMVKDVSISYSKEIKPHNSINRIIQHTKPFYFEGHRFHENNGIFFLIKFRDENIKDIVLSSLKFLEDRGLGSNISSGSGHFKIGKIEIDTELEKNVTNNGQFYLLLSRFIPNKYDIEHLKNHISDSLYDIDFKQGRIMKNSIFKNKIRFFKEGSVFPVNKTNDNWGNVILENNYSKNKYMEYGIPFKVKYVGD
ncbi:MAG: type III-A CRISPR-associated RAMP protein Csm4 [Methanobrevibacter sp.]|jgi:CRISPR-associated protein Csm4|nr:type III-A CRISPR-associated RAMP protein Csm4 [Candidatus Methanoflexus mossambicus]